MQELSSSGLREPEAKFRGVWCCLKWLILVPGGCLSRCQLWGTPRTLPPNLPVLCLGQVLSDGPSSPLATPPALRGGRCPSGASVRPQHQAQPRCQSASLEGNKHVLIKTKHFQTGVSCWNFLAAPKAVVIMETLTGFFFFFFLLLKGCGGHRIMIVFASSLWAEMTTVVIKGGSLNADGTHRSGCPWQCRN